MSVAGTDTLAISLETACSPDCDPFADRLYRQLTGGGYDLMSVLSLAGSLEEWRAERPTARKRADRARGRGYRFVTLRRHERADEIYRINTSATARQGRPMSAGYRLRPAGTPDPEYPCKRHGVHPYGVETADGILVGYLWIYRAGELALVSQILGHAAHLGNEIMYLLWQGMLAHEKAIADGFVVYNRHDSGTDGLRFFKERLGLQQTGVQWLL